MLQIGPVPRHHAAAEVGGTSSLRKRTADGESCYQIAVARYAQIRISIRPGMDSSLA